MTEVAAYIDRHEGHQQAIMHYLHRQLLSFPGITCKLSYSIPFYYRKSWICYLNPVKNNAVEMVFTRGNELSNEQGLLEAKGRKQVLGITFSTVKDIPGQAMNEIIQEALLLDETVPYAAKRGK